MKRYQLAKNAGMPWEVVLVSDAEIDLKVLIRDCAMRGETLSQVNDKVTAFIRKVVSELESEAIKEKVKKSFPMFATRVYYKWLTLFGTKVAAIAFLTALKAQNIDVPQSVKERLADLPNVRNLSGFAQSYVEGAYNRATPNNMYSLEYEKEIRGRINDIADMTAKVDYDTKYSLRASVELEVRYEHNQRQIQSLKDSGVRLAWIDSHANCSERCQEWQGKLYSLDGTSGKQDGVSYQPLENATNIVDKYGYRNGCLSGFNCRHKLIPYKKGFRPIQVPESVMVRQRELEKQQRYMERTVRRYESRALTYKAANETKEYKHYKQLVQEWTKRYEDFSKKNGIPFYPSRLDI